MPPADGIAYRTGTDEVPYGRWNVHHSRGIYPTVGGSSIKAFRSAPGQTALRLSQEHPL